MNLDSARGSRRWTGISAVWAMALVVVGCSSGHSPSGASRTTVPGGTGAGSAAPADGGSGGVVVPPAIDATGRTDVTERLERFISGVGDGSVIRFRARGRYRVNGTLSVNDRHDLTFDGMGATIFAASRGGPNRSQWSIRDGSRITFRNMTVRGANAHGGTSKRAYVAKLAKQHGIRFEGVDGAEVDHVTVTNVYGDFVYVGLDARQVGSRNLWIHDSTFRSNGRQGIAVTAASGVIIERNSFSNTRRSTIDLEPTGHRWNVDHVFVLDNTVRKGRLLFVASHGQGPVNDVVISGNHLIGHGLTIDVLPPKKRRRSNWIVTDNTSNEVAKSRPMRFANIDGLVVRGNHQVVRGGQPGVTLSGVCGAQIDGNDFGAGKVRQSGDPCDARLAVPVLPAIAGRPAGPGSSAFLARPHSVDDRLVWILALVGLVVFVFVVVAAVVMRRRRTHAPPAEQAHD